MTIDQLSTDAKLFLAGALRRMVTADGVITDAEIAWIDRLRDEDRFDSMDEFLDAFAEQVHTDDEFWAFAKSITDVETRSLILHHLEKVAENDGLVHAAEEHLLSQLRSIWSVAK